MFLNKINKWSSAGMFLGFAFSILSSIGYFLFHPDMDRAIVYVLIGFIIIAISYLYEKTLKLNSEVLAIGDYLSDEKLKNE